MFTSITRVDDSYTLPFNTKVSQWAAAALRLRERIIWCLINPRWKKDWIKVGEYFTVKHRVGILVPLKSSAETRPATL
jgi:hypothetical protein